MKTIILMTTCMLFVFSTSAQVDSLVKVIENKVDSFVSEVTTRTLNNRPEKKVDPKPIKTLFHSGKSNGGYFGMRFNHSIINDNEAFGSGVKAAWINNHAFAMGFEGFGFAGSPYFRNTMPQSSIDINGGYGGVFIEPILFPRMPVHVSFPVLFGVGGAAYVSATKLYDNEYIYDVGDADAFTLIEPGVSVELNVFKWFRFGFDLTYRKTFGFTRIGDNQNVLDGMSYGCSLKLGKF